MDTRSVSKRGRHGRPKFMNILRKSKRIRRWFLRNPWVKPMIVFNYAALTIQKCIRGFLVRRRGPKPQTLKALKISRPKGKQSMGNRQLDKYLVTLDNYKKSNFQRPTWIDGGFSSWCAVRIQAVARGRRVRRRYFQKKLITCQIGALVIQTSWRQYMYKKRIASVISIAQDETIHPEPHRKPTKLVSGRRRVFTDVSAATCIQLAWRSFCNKRIYRYFRDLIRFKLKGAPADLLRTIIPNESDLLDRAAGVHVRFRLGGCVFPPKVYFKIFTHRPLCDVGAFAPRDYAMESNQPDFLTENFSKSNKTKGTETNKIKVGTKYFDTVVTTTVGIDRWYKRDENNPWRPISSQIMDEVLAPPWMRDQIMAAKKRTPFHYSRLRRQADIDKLRRERKRQWMLKAYRAAMEAANASDSNGEKMDIFPAIESRSAKYNNRVEYNNNVPQTTSSVSEKRKARAINDSEDVSVSMSESDISGANDARPIFLQHEPPLVNFTRKSKVIDSQDAKQYFGFNENYSNNNNRGFADGNIEPPAAKTAFVDDAELLKWSMALDFDEYTKEWQSLATSLPSNIEPAKAYGQY